MSVADPGDTIPLLTSMHDWVATLLAGRNEPVALVKRIAFLLAGLVRADNGIPHHIARSAHALLRNQPGAPRPRVASVDRRVARTLDDARLDPDRLLRLVAPRAIHALLADRVATHEAHAREHGIPATRKTAGAGAGAAGADRRRTRRRLRDGHEGPHGRWRAVRVILDETSIDNRLHAIVAGIAWQGLVIPVAVRTWPQNVPLAEGAWRGAIADVLREVHAALPSTLCPHVTVVADRAYGSAFVFDYVTGFGWSFVVRLQSHTRVMLPDSTVVRVRDLVRKPGDRWQAPGAPWDVATTTTDTDGVPLVATFKTHGWRPTHVVATWPRDQEEPLLLLTSDRPDAEALDTYARRWGIERTFLAWKSRSWGVERTGVTCAARLGRLLTLHVMATWWVLATAAAATPAILERIAGRRRRRPTAEGSPGATPRRPWRPREAMDGLVRIGRMILKAADARTSTPPRRWALADWDAPCWSDQCLAAVASPP